MTKKTEPNDPSVQHRFKKGQVANPKGRPRKVAEPASAFDVIVDKKLTVNRGGVEREMTVDEGLQHQTYREALAGDRSARREVLKWSDKRDKWLVKHKGPKHPQVISRVEPEDPDNANAALLLLGIASRGDPPWTGIDIKYEMLLLEPWAVQMALSRRRGGTRLSEQEVSEIKRCTRAPHELRWPRSVQE